MTETSGAGDNPDSNGITFLLGVTNRMCNSLEKFAIDFFSIPGFGIFGFTTEDKFVDYVFNMGNNMVAYSIAVGERNTYFLFDHPEYIKTEQNRRMKFLKFHNR